MRLRSDLAMNAALLLLCTGVGACSALGGSSGAEKARVTLKDYRNGQHFELVSESHTDRLTYYSERRADAARKIQTDDVMSALLEELGGRGFDQYLEEGRAPGQAPREIGRAFEVELDGRTHHWLIGTGSDVQERLAFNDCVTPFLQLYNVSTGFQAVENPEGPDLFKERPPRPGSSRRP